MPSVIVIAGPNGAGKSTSAATVLRDGLSVSEFVNADTIAAGLSALSPESVSIAAGRVMLNRIRELVRQRRNFSFETTLASRSFAPWLNDVQEAGYTFRLVYFSLPAVELAIARVADRVRGGGHSVAENIIRRRYHRSLRNFFELYSPFADSWVMLGNALAPPARVIAMRRRGGALRVLDSTRWFAERDEYERSQFTAG